jgi:hypothetical protein
LLSLGREVVDDGGDEVGGFEDFEVSLDRVVAFGAVDDGLDGGVPGDFLKGEGMTAEIFGEAFAAFGVVGWNGFFAAIVDVEAGMLSGEEVGEEAGADVFAIAQGLEETVAEEFDGGLEVFGGHAVETAVGGEEVGEELATASTPATRQSARTEIWKCRSQSKFPRRPPIYRRNGLPQGQLHRLAREIRLPEPHGRRSIHRQTSRHPGQPPGEGRADGDLRPVISPHHSGLILPG